MEEDSGPDSESEPMEAEARQAEAESEGWAAAPHSLPASLQSVASTASTAAAASTAATSLYRNGELEREVLAGLRSLRSDRRLCDVILVGGASLEERAESEASEAGAGVELPAHRALLAAASPYFAAMFGAEMAEARQERVYIQGLAPEALQLLLDYIYSGEILISEENVQMLLPASLLSLSGVREACCEFLRNQLHPSNSLGIKAFADLHACSQLYAMAAAFTEQHFTEIAESEEFLSLTAPDLAALIASDRLLSNGEEKVFEAVMAWVRHRPQQRRAELPRLMEHVRLPLLSRDYLVERVDREPLIMGNTTCMNFIIEAMKFHLMGEEAQTEFRSPRAKPRVPAGQPSLLVVVGGQAPKAIRNVDVFDFGGERWSGVAELPQRRCRCGVAVLNGLVYAVGGFNGSLRVRTVDVWDPERDGWSSAAAMEARRSTLGVAVLAGRIVAVGGFDGSTGLSSCEALDPRSGEWELAAPMGTRRSSVGVGVLDGCLYAVGGYDGQSRQCLATVERYEPRMERWTPAAPMETRRSGAGVAVVAGRLYAVGGHDGPVVRKSAEVFDPVAGLWSPIPDMSLSRRNAGVVAVGGQLFAVGGDDGSSNLVSVEVFHPSANQWSLLRQPMGIGRSYAGVAVIDNPASSAASSAVSTPP